MDRGLFPIVIALLILAIAFGIWFLSRRQQYDYDIVNANNFHLCRNIAGDTVYGEWKDLSYKIAGWNASRNSDDVLRFRLRTEKNDNGKNEPIKIAVDTLNVRYLEVHGHVYDIKNIPVCETDEQE